MEQMKQFFKNLFGYVVQPQEPEEPAMPEEKKSDQERLRPLMIDPEDEPQPEFGIDACLDLCEPVNRLEVWMQRKWAKIADLLEKQDRLKEVIELSNDGKKSMLEVCIAITDLKTYEDLMAQSTSSNAGMKSLPPLRVLKYMDHRVHVLERTLNNEFRGLARKIERMEAEGKSLEHELPSDLVAAIMSPMTPNVEQAQAEALPTDNSSETNAIQPIDTEPTAIAAVSEAQIKSLFSLSPKFKPKMLASLEEDDDLTDTYVSEAEPEPEIRPQTPQNPQRLRRHQRQQSSPIPIPSRGKKEERPFFI